MKASLLADDMGNAPARTTDNIGDDSDDSVVMYEMDQNYWDRQQRREEMEQEKGLDEWVDHIELERLDREEEDDPEKPAPPPLKKQDSADLQWKYMAHGTNQHQRTHIDDMEFDADIPDAFKNWARDTENGGDTTKTAGEGATPVGSTRGNRRKNNKKGKKNKNKKGNRNKK